jgi:hypothetical protein
LTGQWTISGTVSGTPYSTTANVTSLSTPVSVNLETIPDGSTATPTDVVQTWLKCAGINDKNYTTVAQVLGDSTTLLALISDNNAVDYMVRSTTWASDVCADSTAMTDIGANNYCADTLLSDATWASAIANSTYFESVLNVKVPTMTSATAPSGEVTQSTYQSGYAGFNAFNSSDSTPWIAQDNKGSVEDWVAYEFTSAVYVSKVTVQGSTSRPITVHVEAYLNGSWESISSDTSISDDNAHTIICNSVETSTKFRLYCVAQSASLCAFVRYLQFYGRTTS